MDRLWSPWRMEYILADKSGDGCIFCSKPAEDQDRENLILYRGNHAFIILNRYPYNAGHLMVVPYEHVSSTEDLDAEVLAEVMELVNLSIGVLRDAMRPEGFNIGWYIANTNSEIQSVFIAASNPMDITGIKLWSASVGWTRSPGWFRLSNWNGSGWTPLYTQGGISWTSGRQEKVWTW